MLTRKVLVLLLLIAGVPSLAGCSTSGAFFSEKPVQQVPYIIVYGRESCPACTTFKQKLDDSGVRYTSKDMGDPNVRDEVISRLEKAGFTAERFSIPVIDVNGDLAIRPPLTDVLDRYSNPSLGEQPPADNLAPAACHGLPACVEAH